MARTRTLKSSGKRAILDEDVPVKDTIAQRVKRLDFSTKRRKLVAVTVLGLLVLGSILPFLPYGEEGPKYARGYALIEFSEIIRPSSDSAVQWDRNTGSTNYECVDEATVGGDGDTTYVYTGTNGEYDRYGMSDMSEEDRGEYTEIDSVTMWVWARRGGTGTAQLQAGVRIGTTDYTGINTVSLSTSYVNFTYTWTQNPATSADWTITEVNALICFITTGDAVPNPYVTQVAVIVPGRQVVWGPTFTSTPDTDAYVNNPYSYTVTVNETSDFYVEYTGEGDEVEADPSIYQYKTDEASATQAYVPWDNFDWGTYNLLAFDLSEVPEDADLTDITVYVYKTYDNTGTGTPVLTLNCSQPFGGTSGGLVRTQANLEALLPAGSLVDTFAGYDGGFAWYSANGICDEWQSQFDVNQTIYMGFTISPWVSTYDGSFGQNLTTCNIVVEYEAVIIPDWLTFTEANATLWGTPTETGEYGVSINATSVSGGQSAWQNFTITVTEPWTPTFTSTAPTAAVVGFEYNYSYTTNETCTFDVTITNPTGDPVEVTEYLNDTWAYYKYKDTSATEAYVSYPVWDFDRFNFFRLDLSSLPDDAELVSMNIDVFQTYATQTEYTQMVNRSVAWGGANGSYTATWLEAYLKTLLPAGSYVFTGAVEETSSVWNNFTGSATSWQTQFDINKTIYLAFTGFDWDSTGSFGWNLTTARFDIEYTTMGAGEELTFLSWEDAEDFIWGTPGAEDEGYEWDVSIEATNSLGGVTYQNFTVTVGEGWGPTFTSSGDTTASVGSAYSYTPTCNETVTWPSSITTNATWLTWTQANNTVWGTPALCDLGSFYVNISATSVLGYLDSYQNYTVTVTEEDTTDPVAIAQWGYRTSTLPIPFRPDTSVNLTEYDCGLRLYISAYYSYDNIGLYNGTVNYTIDDGPSTNLGTLTVSGGLLLYLSIIPYQPGEYDFNLTVRDTSDNIDWTTWTIDFSQSSTLRPYTSWVAGASGTAYDITRPIGDSPSSWYDEWAAYYGSDKYAMVDETTSGGDGDTTYIYVNAGSEFQLFSLCDISDRTGYDISSVTIWAIAKRSTWGVGSFSLSSGTLNAAYGWSTITLTNTAFQNFTASRTTNPIDGEAWELSDINAMYAGVGWGSYAVVTQVGVRITWVEEGTVDWENQYGSSAYPSAYYSYIDDYDFVDAIPDANTSYIRAGPIADTGYVVFHLYNYYETINGWGASTNFNVTMFVWALSSVAGDEIRAGIMGPTGLAYYFSPDLTLAYANYSYTWETCPWTGSDWTQTDINQTMIWFRGLDLDGTIRITYSAIIVGEAYLDITDPTANAGADQEIDEGDTCYFSGAGSTDDVGIVNYTWTFTDGTLQTLYGVSASYVFTTNGTYIVTLNVTDAAGNWDTDTMTVTVVVPHPTFAEQVYGNMGDLTLIVMCAMGLIGMIVTPAFYVKYGREDKQRALVLAIFWFVLFFGLFYAGLYSFL